ncbi:MAG: PSD1 and planctomycete cytochrome C domain-containing protein [Planctomycetaceae bacterium]
MTQRAHTRFLACATLVACCSVWPLAADEAPRPTPTPAQIEFFETKVRPVFAAKCQKCHAGEKHKGGLSLDSLSAILAGGDSGPALVAGKPEESLLIEALNYNGLEMPPTGKLAEGEIAAITDWVKMGAPWPAEQPGAVTRKGDFQITDDDRNHWSFKPLVRPSVPTIRQPAAAANAIDHFLLARLDEKSIAPNPEADKRSLLRRAWYDLVGLPPSADDVRAFAADDSPLAFERAIDRLLASPHYGERWGRHWLDLVRFAQTNGYERDDEKPEAWRFRDYVIDSLNADKPYDRFLREQLAGDELDDVSRETIIATGFYRLGVWDDEPDDRRTAEFDELDEMLKTTGSAFLGLTLGCARCHDHKFDPLPQEDYYRLLAFFRNVEPYGAALSETHFGPNKKGIFTPLPTGNQVAEWKAREQKLQAELTQLRGQIASIEKQLNPGTAEAKKKLEGEIKRVSEELERVPFEVALSVREPHAGTKATHVLVRGSALSPGKKVEAGLPKIFGGSEATKPVSLALNETNKPNDWRGMLSELGVQKSPGRRRALADWIVSSDNPLTARVFVNRLWQHHFGRGIVSSSDNFGRAGDKPTHPELLDWLAREFIDGGFRIKKLHRLIMTSNAYRMSSAADNPTAHAIDPGNELFWRQNLRRLDAEAIRDSVLAASGRLNTLMTGRGIFPALSQEVLATQSKPGHGWGKSNPVEEDRRSVYIYVKRTLMVPMLEAFDYTNTAETLGVRPITTVAPQALMLLNSEFLRSQAVALTDRATSEGGASDSEFATIAFRRTLGRDPSEQERNVAVEMLAEQRQRFLSKTGTTDETASREAKRSLCLVLLNLNEFVYVD